jgi:hypothetical protein
VDVPVHSFSGSEEGEEGGLYLMNSKTSKSLDADATIALSYFTRIGPVIKSTSADGDAHTVRLDHSPFS